MGGQDYVDNFWTHLAIFVGAPQVPLVLKNPPATAGVIRDLGLISGLGRSPGGGNDNPLQYSCLENPMDRGAWRAKVHEVTKSDTTEQLSTARSTAVSYLPKHTILFKYIRDCSQM